MRVFRSIDLRCEHVRARAPGRREVVHLPPEHHRDPEHAGRPDRNRHGSCCRLNEAGFAGKTRYRPVAAPSGLVPPPPVIVALK
jgi:hypothetical protein